MTHSERTRQFVSLIETPLTQTPWMKWHRQYPVWFDSERPAGKTFTQIAGKRKAAPVLQGLHQFVDRKSIAIECLGSIECRRLVETGAAYSPAGAR